ncbi:hypothetical protein JCM11641_002950 [Rhodosporidiobolus odoratus]
MPHAAQQVSSSLSRHSAPRWQRANFWLGKLIPTLLLIFATMGYRLVIAEVFPLVYRRSRPEGLTYFGWVHLTLALTGWSYLKVYFQSLDPPREKEPPLEVLERRVVFACHADGQPMRCLRDRCAGAWQSLRTRHCRDCGTCRERFDHHCAFMDNCVSATTFKPFFTFLLYAFLLLIVALVPLTPLQLKACREVIQQTWSTPFMQDRWWSRWYSWAGGPVWRYGGALFLGYEHYHRLAPDRPPLIPDVRTRFIRQGPATFAYDEPLYPSLAIPRLSTLVIVLFAALISAIALAMLVTVIRNTTTGFSTVQLERTRRYRRQVAPTPAQSGQPENPAAYDARFRLWIPLSRDECPAGGSVVLVEPDAPLFDFGSRENWKSAMGERWWKWVVPWETG